MISVNRPLAIFLYKSSLASYPFIFHLTGAAYQDHEWMFSLIGGPCLSSSTWLKIDSTSWHARPRTSSTSCVEAWWGVNGFGSLCRNKRILATGPRPGTSRTVKKFQLGQYYWKYCILRSPKMGKLIGEPIVKKVGWKEGLGCIGLDHIFLLYFYIDGGCLNRAIQVAPFSHGLGKHEYVK